MRLINLLYPKYKTMSVVGTSKNAGKTVTVNEIISQASEQGIALGLISTGRDGERRDVLTNTEKPAVFAPKGTIIATVEEAVGGAAEADKADIEILEVTSFNTPMGKVVLGKVLENGFVEISGPRSSSTIRQVCDMMQQAGAEFVIIDGSLDRRASAAPFVSDCTVIAAGASLSRNMDTVVQKTRHIAALYSIPEADQAVLGIAADAIEKGETIIINEDGSCKTVETQTSLLCGAIVAECLDKNSSHVVLSGSASFETLRDIVLDKNSNVQIIVKDATRIFVTENELFMLHKMGMDLRVAESITVAAITVNPYSPEGYFFDPAEFLRKMREAIPNIPVFDVMQEGC
jgi:hypothetical protein